MQNRDDVDGSQRPRTVDAPEMKTVNDGHLGRGGDPVEGRDPSQPASEAGAGGPSAADHLGPGGDPVEGDPAAVEGSASSGLDAADTPAKE